MPEPRPARTTRDKIRLFRDCFTGLPSVYGTYDPRTSRVWQVKEPVTDQVLLQHLQGHQPYGVYLLVADRTRAVVADFDDQDPEPPLAFIRRAMDHSVHSYLERSRRKGWHVWVFARSPGVSAAKARSVIRLILGQIGHPSTEVFPRHDRLTHQGFYGNFINTPLYGRLVTKGRTVFVDTDGNLEPFSDQWRILESVQRVDERQLDDIIRVYGSVPQAHSSFASSSSSEDVLEARTFGLPPCARRMLAEGVSEHQRVACFRLALHLRKAGLTRELVVTTLKVWATRNRPRHDRRIITEPEIVAQTACAFDRPYRGCGCEEPAVTPFCTEHCPLKTSDRATGVSGESLVHQHERNTEMGCQQPTKPVREFRAGGASAITAAVWRNERDRDGQIVVNHSIRLQKRYYDRDTQSWQDSDCFFPEDLPKLRLVIDKAYEYVVLRERDPGVETPRDRSEPAQVKSAELDDAE